MEQRQYPPIAEPLAGGPFLPAWQPQTVDQVPRCARITAAVLATAIATFVPAPSALEAAARATYPDQIHRARVHASQQQAWAGPVAPLDAATPLTWSPSYPERIPRLTLPTSQQQTQVGPVAPSGAGDLRWQSRFPEQVRGRAIHVSQQQFLALHPDPIAAAAAVPEQWTPTYPSRLTRSAYPTFLQQAWTGATRPDQQAPSAPASSGVVTRPTQVQYQSLTGPVLVPAVLPDLSWTPEYPDQFLRRLQPAALHLASVLSPEPITAVAAPELSWSPRYSSLLLPRPGLSAAGQLSLAFWPEPLPNAAAPELSWAPTYPGQLLPAQALLASQQQAFAFYTVPIPSVGGTTLHRLLLALTTEVPVPLVVPELSWSPSYPTQIAGRPPLRLTFRVDPFIPAQLPTALSWAPAFPDRAVRLVLPVSQHRALAYYPTPIAAVVIEGLPWYPTFPDLLLPRKYLTTLQQTFAQHVEPISTAALVPLTWDPHYPHLLLPARRALPPSGMAAPAPSETATVIAATWHPVYPVYVWHVPVPPQAPWPLVPIDILTIADDTTCVELVDLGATQSTLLDLRVTQSTILGPDGTLAGISVEIC